MIRHACPHQQVLCSLVEPDWAADHVVRGLLEQLRSFKILTTASGGVQIAFLKQTMGNWVNLRDLAIWIPLQTHLSWLYNPAKLCQLQKKKKKRTHSCTCVEFHVDGLFRADESAHWPAEWFSALGLLSEGTSERNKREDSVCRKRKVSATDCGEMFWSLWHIWGLRVLKLVLGFISSHLLFFGLQK